MSNKSYNSVKNGVRARVASSARVFTSPKITRTQYNCRPNSHLLIFSWTEGQKIQKKYAPQKNMFLMFLCLNYPYVCHIDAIQSHSYVWVDS